MTDTEATWRERVAAWKASGKTCPSFCEGQPFAPNTLRQWHFQLKKRDREREAKGQGVRMVAISRTPSAPHEPSPPLVLATRGARIEVRRGFDAVLLRQVLSALAETP